MRRALLIVALGCFGVIPARAGDAASAPVTDPAQVTAHYRETLQKPEFRDSGGIDVDERLRDVLAQWFYKLGEKLSQFKYVSEMSQVASLMLTSMVFLCLSGLIYVIVRVYRRRAELDLDLETDAPGPKTFRPPEFYEKEIQQAILTGDWHAAWLAAWRQFLSRLENCRLVEADRTRTNREYLDQLRGRILPLPALALLIAVVDAYDRFIYGHQPISEADWNLFHQQVSEAGLLLHLDDKSLPSQPATP